MAPACFVAICPIKVEARAGPDAAGFWATGDYGEFDADGFLRLVGRKSDNFKLSTGRWIAPAGVEALLRRLPYVEHAMAVGAGHRFVVAILAVDLAKLSAGTRRRGRAAPTKQLSARIPDEVIRRDVIAAMAELPPHERPAGVLVTANPLSIEGGELTSNLKLRRSAVEAKYAVEIDAIYAVLEGRAGQSDRDAPGDAASPLVRWT